jgi:hypothetical protein
MRYLALATCIVLSGHPLSNAQRPPASEELKRSSAYVITAEHELAEAKASALRTFASVQSRVIEADAQSEKWERLANLEGEARMKAINYGFRDAFASHSRGLAEIVQALRDFSRLGEGLESRVTLLRTLQGDLEQVVGSNASSRNTRSLLSRTKEGLGLLQRDLTLSAEQLKFSRNKLSDLTIASRQYDRKVRQLVAFIGDPQDRIKQWEKQVAQTEVDNNSKEATELANVAALDARIENAIAALENATKSLQLTTILKRRGRPRLARRRRKRKGVSTSAALSERELQRQLKTPRRCDRARRLSEAGRFQVPDGDAVVRPVDEVKGVHSEA